MSNIITQPPRLLGSLTKHSITIWIYEYMKEYGSDQFLKSEPQSLAFKNIKSVQRFRFKRLSALFYFATIHLREVS